MDSLLKRITALRTARSVSVRWMVFPLLMLIAVSAHAVEFRLPNELPAVPGQEVVVAVQADDADGMTGFRIVMNYDADKVSYVAGSASVDGTIADGFLTPQANTNTPGQLVMSSAGFSAVDPTSGTLITFRLLLSDFATVGATYPLTFNSALTRANDGALALTLYDGSLLAERTTTLRLTSNAIPNVATGEATMVVSAESLVGISSFDLVVEADASAVEFVMGSAATVPSAAFGPVTVTSLGEGRWRFQAETLSPATEGSGQLLSFCLRVIEPAIEDRVIPVTFVSASSSLNGGAIGVTLIDGSIDVRRLIAVDLPLGVSAEPGEVVDLAFSLDEYTGLQGFRFVVNFPADQVSYQPGSAVTGPFFNEDFSVLAVNYLTPGRLVVSGAAESPLTGGTGSLLRFRMRVAPTVPLGTVIPLAFDRTLSRLNDGVLGARFADGSIIVQRVIRLTIPSDIPGVPGTEVVVPVLADEVRGIEGFRIATLWPAEKASFVPRSATNIGTLSEYFVALITNAATPGRLIVSSSGEEPLPTGSGTLLTYRLAIPATAEAIGTIPLTLDPSLTRINDGQFQVELVNGTIRLGPDATIPTECMIPVDILLGIQPSTPSADTNDDGIIDIADLVFCANNSDE